MSVLVIKVSKENLMTSRPGAAHWTYGGLTMKGMLQVWAQGEY